MSWDTGLQDEDGPKWDGIQTDGGVMSQLDASPWHRGWIAGDTHVGQKGQDPHWDQL